MVETAKADTGSISDGYHTFDELYAHRIELYLALCRLINEWHSKFGRNSNPVWKSWIHSDGTDYKGWFVLGLFKQQGQQITYHVPEARWGDIDCEVLPQAPKFDGHTSADVIERLKRV